MYVIVQILQSGIQIPVGDNVQVEAGDYQSSNRMSTSVLSWGVKRSGHEDKCSPPSMHP